LIPLSGRRIALTLYVPILPDNRAFTGAGSVLPRAANGESLRMVRSNARWSGLLSLEAVAT